MIAGTHNGQTNEQVIAMLLQTLLLAHEHLVNCGTSPTAVNMQIEYALLMAGVEAQTLVAQCKMPATANMGRPILRSLPAK